jgi:tetratricopeptide (TPR) repeat protein
MLDEQILSSESGGELFIQAKDIELFVDDGNGTPLTITLPSPQEMGQLYIPDNARISLKQVTSVSDIFHVRTLASKEIERTLLKQDKYNNSPNYYSNLAILSELSGDMSSALKFTTQALSLSSNKKQSNFYRYKLANRQVGNGDIEAAKKTLFNIDLLDDVQAQMQYASILLCEAHFNSAATCIDKLLSNNNDDSRALAFKGTSELIKKNSPDAIKHLRRSLEYSPKNSHVCINLAMAYIQAGYKGKAFTALRRAIHLDPLNEDAILLFSNIADKNTVDEVIKHLEFFSNYERNTLAVWEQLAFNYLHKAKEKFISKRKYVLKALDALKHTHTIATVEKPSTTPSILNNIAVCYFDLGEKEKSLRYYLKTIELSNPEEEIFFIALTNITSALITSQQYQRLLKFLPPFLPQLKHGESFELQRKRSLVNYAKALIKLNQEADAVGFVESLLEKNLPAEIRAEFYIILVHYYSSISVDFSKLKSFIPNIELIFFEEKLPDRVYYCLANNLMFIQLLTENIDGVYQILPYLSTKVNVDPYVTATFGMFHLRKGNLEKGKALYQNAIALLNNKVAKELFKQRYDFEHANALLKTNKTQKAIRLLTKVKLYKHGGKYLTLKANELLMNKLKP